MMYAFFSFISECVFDQDILFNEMKQNTFLMTFYLIYFIKFANQNAVDMYAKQINTLIFDLSLAL